MAEGDEVARHYDEMTSSVKRRRGEDPYRNPGRDHTTLIRQYNNWVKAVLIRTYGGSRSRVLDIGCGRGQDVGKWLRMNVRGYVGVDVSREAVNECRRRWRDANVQVLQCDLRETIFFLEPDSVDVVTCMFTLHYFWDSEHMARMLLCSLTSSLRRSGGTVILTFPDARVLERELGDGEVRQPGKGGHEAPGCTPCPNDAYRVREMQGGVTLCMKETQWQAMQRRGGAAEGGAFGWKYWFTLRGAIESCPEYVVPLDSLLTLCSDFGLVLKAHGNFHDMSVDRTPCIPLHDMCSINTIYDIPRHQWDCIGLYRYAVFTFHVTTEDGQTWT